MLLAEKCCRGREQPLPCGDLEVNESGQREIHLGDFFEIDLLTQAAEADEFFLGEHQWCRLPKRAPLGAIELDVGAGFAHSEVHTSCAWCVPGSTHQAHEGH